MGNVAAPQPKKGFCNIDFAAKMKIDCLLYALFG